MNLGIFAHLPAALATGDASVVAAAADVIRALATGDASVVAAVADVIRCLRGGGEIFVHLPAALASGDTSAAADVIRALATGDASVVAAAAGVIRSASHTTDAVATVKVLQWLRSSDANVRSGACLLLRAAAGKQTLWIRSSDANVRSGACLLLRAAAGKQGLALALRHVSNEFRNADPGVRIAAARAVCVVTEESTLKKVMDSLQRACANESDPAARWAYLQSMKLLAEHKGAPPARCVAALPSFSDQRAAALHAVSARQGEQASRVAAVRTLGEMLRARDPEVESALWGMLLGENNAAAAVVRASAAAALDAISPPEAHAPRFGTGSQVRTSTDALLPPAGEPGAAAGGEGLVGMLLDASGRAGGAALTDPDAAVRRAVSQCIARRARVGDAEVVGRITDLLIR
ncbi:hypothetical protein T484DRAFT_1896505, partial [Baffinella frigidus]